MIRLSGGCRLMLSVLVLVVAAGAAEASSTGRCGGGGPKTKALSCPSGAYVVGISARGTAFVDQIGIRCAKFAAAGKRIGQGSWFTGGPGGGNFNGDANCGTTKAVKGISLLAGTYVDKVTEIMCAKRNAGGGFAGITDRPTIEIGGWGGLYGELKCPASEALSGVTITHGSWVDSITGTCRP